MTLTGRANWGTALLTVKLGAVGIPLPLCHLLLRKDRLVPLRKDRLAGNCSYEIKKYN